MKDSGGDLDFLTFEFLRLCQHRPADVGVAAHGAGVAGVVSRGGGGGVAGRVLAAKLAGEGAAPGRKGGGGLVVLVQTGGAGGIRRGGRRGGGRGRPLDLRLRRGRPLSAAVAAVADAVPTLGDASAQAAGGSCNIG